MSGVVHGALKALLRIQSVICPRVFPKPPKYSGERSFIFGQGELKGSRLYLAKAEYTACEVIAIYNAIVYFGLPGSFSEVRSAFMRRGALTLWPLGFFGGNPYSLGRVMSAFGLNYERTKDFSADGRYIISFFNGPKNPSIHTVFAVREGGKLRVYNFYSTDLAPRTIELSCSSRPTVAAFYLR